VPLGYTRQVQRALGLALSIVLAGCSAREVPSWSPPRAQDAAARPTDAGLASVRPTAPGLRLPDTATPLAYDLRLELDPDRESFRGTVEIRIRLRRPSDHVWLHVVELEIASASFRAGPRNGALAPLDIRNPDGMEAFGFGATLPEGELTLVFDYTGHFSRNDEGLFRQQAGGRWFLYSQAESMFARRILPCFDEPGWKPAWRVTLIVPGKQVALGNGPLVSDTLLADGRREIKLAEIAPMPSYLLAVAVGPFVLVEAGRLGRARVPVRIAVAPGDERRVGIVAAKLPAVVEALERYVDQPLPWPKLDLVAVPRFFGAMENIGLVTFQSSILVGDPKSPARARRFIRFAAHELAHQWFGNVVTPAWWDDLWLSEGLSTWLGEKVSDELGGHDDRVLRGQLARLHALGADDAPDPRPLRRAITSTDDVDDRFDAISYEKGGAVLEMFERFVGTDAFRDAIRGYLRTRANASATAADFLAALGAVAPNTVAPFRAYLQRPGVPVVEIALRCAGATPAIELHSRDGTGVPVCVRHAKGTGSARTCGIAGDRERISLGECPSWLIANAGGDGYYRVATPTAGSQAPMTPTEQLAYADDVAAALLRGELAAGEVLRELRALASRDQVSQLAALEIAEAIDPLVDDVTRPAWSRWLAARFANRIGKAAMLGARTPVELQLRDRLAQLIGADRFEAATASASRTIVERAFANDHAPPEYLLAIAAPRGGKLLFDRIVARAAAAPDERQAWLLEALGAFGPDLAPRLVELVGDPRFKPGRVWPAVAAMLSRPQTRSAAWRAVRARLPQIVAQFAASELPQVIEPLGSLCDATSRGEVALSFGANADDLLAAVLMRTLASIDRCVLHHTRLGGLAAALQ